MGKHPMKHERPIYRIEVLDVFYLYSCGEEFIAIATAPKGQHGEVPQWARVDISIERPPMYRVPIDPNRNSKILDGLVAKEIRAKVAEQHRRPQSSPAASKKVKPEQQDLFKS